MRWFLLGIVIVWGWADPCAAQIGPPIIGWARAVDGDTLVLTGQPLAAGQPLGLAYHKARIRLRNFNAPELSDPGGTAAKQALESLVEGYEVTCLPVARDKYARWVASCSTADTPDLAAAMKAMGITQKRRKT